MEFIKYLSSTVTYFYRRQVTAFKSSKQSHHLRPFTDCSKNISLVSARSNPWQVKTSDCKMRLCVPVLSVFSKVCLRYTISQTDSGTVARHHERDWRQIWLQCSHLFRVPQVASDVQRFLFLGQLWFYHHSAACSWPFTQHTFKRELQRAGVTDRSCKWTTAH